jgi:YD repeat-containing protein
MDNLPSSQIFDGDNTSDRILWSDMNGNGSTDIVWFTHDKKMQFLDLYPTRPHLISRIENGLGQVTEITFEPSVHHRARDLSKGKTWMYPLPFPQQVVSEIDTWEKIAPSGVDSTEYRYHDGFYDGTEKQFRGYERVEQLGEGDDYEASSRTLSIFDVGAPNDTLAGRVNPVYWNGKLLEQSVFGGVDMDGDGEITAGEEDLPISITVNTYAECSVSVSSGDGGRGCNAFGRIGSVTESETDLDFDGVNEPVINLGVVSSHLTIKEGLVVREDLWEVTRSEYSFDGFGNEVYAESLGADSLSGDEIYAFTSYIPVGDATNGRWRLGLISESYLAGVPLANVSAGELPTLGALPALYTHGRNYYDGLTLGQSDKGLVTKAEWRLDKSVSDAGVVSSEDRFVTDSTTSYDRHGNPWVSRDVLGNARGYHYDDDGLLAVEVFAQRSADGFLCRQVEYDPIWSKPTKGYSWVVGEGVVSEEVLSALTCDVTDQTPSSEYRYDEFGRVTSFAKPGDSISAPSEEYEYRWGLGPDGVADPKTAVRSETVTRLRTVKNGPLDLEQIACLDGRAREFQRLQLLKAEIDGEDYYQTSGFIVYNKKGKTVKTYVPYQQPLASKCDSREPSHDHTISKYDGNGRVIKVTYPDGVFINTTFAPLSMSVWDEKRNKTREWTDGLDRTVALQRPLLVGQDEETRYYTLQYDDLGRLLSYVDGAGNMKSQEYDLKDRVLTVVDPNGGRYWYRYDDLGRVVAKGDARGKVLLTEYDYFSRKVKEWDADDEAGTVQRWYYDVSTDGCVVDGEDKCSNVEGKEVKKSYAAEGCPDNGVCKEWSGYSARGSGVYHGATLPDSNGYRFESASVFDNAGRLVETKYADGRLVEFEYDGAGRFSGVKSGGLTLVELKYNALGLRSSESFSNGVSDLYTYNNRLRLDNHTTTGRDGDYQNFTYSWDEVGNITGIVDESLYAGFWSGQYEYDDWYRLTKATIGSAQTVIPYEYNEIDNITLRGTDVVDYDPGRPNAVVGIGGLTYSYDAAGYVSKRGDTNLKWDAWGRLTEASVDGTVTGLFLYGSQSKRTLKIEPELTGWSHYVTPAFEVRNGVAVVYLRVDNRRVARFENTDFATKVLDDQDGDGEIHINDAWLWQKNNP